MLHPQHNVFHFLCSYFRGAVAACRAFVSGFLVSGRKRNLRKPCKTAPCGGFKILTGRKKISHT